MGAPKCVWAASSILSREKDQFGRGQMVKKRIKQLYCLQQRPRAYLITSVKTRVVWFQVLKI
jgi:hypothetical protein